MCRSKAPTFICLCICALLGSRTNFVSPRPRARTAPKVPRHSAKPLQLPEANYFRQIDIRHCIEDGCTLEQNAELEQKLQRDGERLEKEIDAVEEATKMDHSKNIRTWLAHLQNHLEKIHNLQNNLKAAMGVQDSDFGNGFIASVFFGSGDTAGYLNLMQRHPAPQRRARSRVAE